MERLEQRLNELESKMERNNRHLLDVMATHRETVEKALQQVQVALLEQHMTIRSHILSNEETFKDMMVEVKTTLADFDKRLNRLEKPPAA
ncbi:MAG: hypothetical protein ACYCW6_23740 [Candidatus Xenobia bacterium]